MRRLTKLITILALLALVFLPTSSARAMGPFDGGPVIFGGNYTLASGDTLNGDLVVFGGNVIIEEDALVKGSIIIFGGNIILDGTMTEDLVLIGGSGTMGKESVIEGDLITVGGSMTRAEGSRVEGEIRNETSIEVPVPTIPEVPEVPEIPEVPVVPEVPSVPEVGQPNINFDPFGSAFGVLAQAILIGALAMVLSLFLRPQMDHISDVFFRQPLVAGGAGLLSIFAILVSFVTIVLIPLGLLALFLVLPLAWLFGIISIGTEVGERFTRSVGQSWSPVLTAGFGTFLMVLVVQGFGLIPCIGWLFSFLVGAAGVGAVVMALLEARNRPMMASPASSLNETLPPTA